MLNIKLKLYHPLSRDYTNRPYGVVLDKQVYEDESIAQFFARMQRNDDPVWNEVWDSKRNKIVEDRVVVLNDTLLTEKQLDTTFFSEGDTLGLRKVFHGG